jgi:hypothetical protein
MLAVILIILIVFFIVRANPLKEGFQSIYKCKTCSDLTVPKRVVNNPFVWPMDSSIRASDGIRQMAVPDHEEPNQQ